jgi:hypothetical protein
MVGSAGTRVEYYDGARGNLDRHGVQFRRE